MTGSTGDITEDSDTVVAVTEDSGLKLSGFLSSSSKMEAVCPWKKKKDWQEAKDNHSLVILSK